MDISGYSHLAERVSPVELNALVERYFGSFLDHETSRATASSGSGTSA